VRLWGVLIVLAWATPGFAAPNPLKKECDAARGKRPVTAVNPLAIKLTKSSEPVRSATLRRFVQCGYRNKQFVRAIETEILTINTQDRGNVQFDTKVATQGKSYFIECETELNVPLAKLVKGFKAPLYLSCVHRIARLDGGEPDRVTGVHSFKPKPGTLEITAAKGMTMTLRFDATVENQFEVVRLDGEASGAMSNAIEVVNCPPRNPRSRSPVPAPCG
jgi:hypothetical protein